MCLWRLFALVVSHAMIALGPLPVLVLAQDTAGPQPETGSLGSVIDRLREACARCLPP